jgi:hypothetical protein
VKIMLHVCLASILGLALAPAAQAGPTDTLSARAIEIEARVAALTQRNDAMGAGRTAAKAMRSPDLSRTDRYHLGSLAFEAYFVAHLNAPNIEALCEARRVARAMKQVATTADQTAGARGLVGQVDQELARMRPPGSCEKTSAGAAKAPPELMAVRPSPPVQIEESAPTVQPGPHANPPSNPRVPPADAGTLERPVAAETPSPSPPRPTSSLPTVPRPAPGSPDTSRPWTPRAWAGLGTMILGTGLLAGMGASLRGRQVANDRIFELDRQIEMENRNPTVDESLSFQQANLRWQRFTTAAVVTGSVGAATLITGAVLLATGVRRRSVEVTPWGGATSAGLLLRGRF